MTHARQPHVLIRILAKGPAMILNIVSANILFPRGKMRGRAFAHGAMGRRIDPSWGGPIELFLVPASAPRLV